MTATQSWRSLSVNPQFDLLNIYQTKPLTAVVLSVNFLWHLQNKSISQRTVEIAMRSCSSQVLCYVIGI